MRLFDDIDRTRPEPAGHSQPTFEYMNSTGRTEFGLVRVFLEEWFDAYPDAHKLNLRSRFRSPIDTQHHAAFFELLLFQLFRRLGATAEVHPPLPGQSRSPDFLIHPLDNASFLVEATIVTFLSDEDAAGEARLRQVYDVLDRHVDSANFFIWVDVDSSPKTPPPARRIATFINEKLRGVDPDSLASAHQEGGNDALPVWPFSHDGWSILFRPIPKKPAARGKLGIRPLGMFSTGFRSVDHRTPIRVAALNKARSYGPVQLPFVIAINALEPIDDIDINEALFGREKVTVYFRDGNPTGPERTEMSRDPDGLWTSPSGPARTQVSAVLIASLLRPWSLGDARLALYHNPWATNPLAFGMHRIQQHMPRDRHLVRVEGEPLSSLLGTPWPLVAA